MGDDPSQTWDTFDLTKVLFFLAAICALYAGLCLYRFVRRVEERSAKGLSTSIDDASTALMALSGCLVLAGAGYVLRYFIFPMLG